MTSDALSIGRLHLRQRPLTAAPTPPLAYDLVLCAVSWETRNATAFDAFGGSSDPAVLLRFESGKPDADAAKDTNQAALAALLPNHEPLALARSTDFDANSETLQALIRDRFIQAKRPLKVLMDITCIPKCYVSFMCGLGFGNDYFCRLDCLYAEGAYTLTGVQAATRGPLSITSEGEWTSLQVPYLEAANIFSSERDLIVVLGGEIGYSLPFIERYEPERLSVVFIKDGPGADELEGSERAAYLELTSDPRLDRAEIAIGDAVAVLAHVHAFCASAPSRSIVGLAIGSKAQSLALALAALDIENLEIVCRVPSAYSLKDVCPTGRVFVYEIEDRFEPMAYFD
jgi:hypothetical protein